jgi:hypothetical protein
MSMENLKEKENTFGGMGIHMLETFSMDSNMGRGSGLKEEKQTPNTKGIMNMIRKMGKESLYGQAVTSTLEITKMMNGMDLERCSGLMVHNMKGIGYMEYNMAWEK